MAFKEGEDYTMRKEKTGAPTLLFRAYVGLSKKMFFSRFFKSAELPLINISIKLHGDTGYSVNVWELPYMEQNPQTMESLIPACKELIRVYEERLADRAAREAVGLPPKKNV